MTSAISSVWAARPKMVVVPIAVVSSAGWTAVYTGPGETVFTLTPAGRACVDQAVDILESLVERSLREQSWLMLATAATALAVMYIECGDIARSVDTAQRPARHVEDAGLAGTDEHVRLGSVLVSALFERGDLLFATRTVEELIGVADQVGLETAAQDLDFGKLGHDGWILAAIGGDWRQSSAEFRGSNPCCKGRPKPELVRTGPPG